VPARSARWQTPFSHVHRGKSQEGGRPPVNPRSKRS
jgi:hypothetical protein